MRLPRSSSGSYVGSHFLNKRNTARAGDYLNWSAGVGYSTKNWEAPDIPMWRAARPPGPGASPHSQAAAENGPA